MIVDDVISATRARLGARANGPSRAGGAAPDLEVAVIGAGPHGLSAAVHLRREGVAAQVFGPSMSFWRGMPKGMRLRSNMSATNMIEPAGPFSLSSYMAEIGEQFGHPVSLQRFVDYGSWVQQRAVPDLDTRLVARIARSGDGFGLELADGGHVTARRVVVACGIAAFENTPPGFDHLPHGLVSHTGHHDDLARFAGKRVAVVGGGQSAFESAVLMNERGAEVELIARGDEIVWLRSWSPIHFMGRLGKVVYAPTDVGPLWYSRLVATPALFTRLPRETQDRIAQRSIRPACSYFVKVRIDGVRMTTATEVTRAVPAGEQLELTLSDGTTRAVDHLMFGTGYKVDVRRYPFLSETLLTDLKVVDGCPVLRRGFESSIPGLHFLGAPAARSFGPIMRFVSGSWYGGSRVAQGIALVSGSR
ncbi:MAG TPA: FAD-dependent oxidoreductase [Solirubrobacteraceae bacterium]|nr:FAD-dependent oxidoreductase [Solirubrobacteraceae bacterium]